MGEVIAKLQWTQLRDQVLEAVAQEQLETFDPASHPVTKHAFRPMSENEKVKLLKRQYLQSIYAAVDAQLRAEGIDPKSLRVKTRAVSTDRDHLPLLQVRPERKGSTSP